MSPRKQAAVVLGLTLIYAIVRYVLCHDVAWANVPLYILNKAISWTGLILFGMSVATRTKSSRREFGVLASGAIAAHLIMSLMVLNPNYFAKFYEESGRMTAMAEISMLAGVIGALFLGGLFTANMAGSGEGRSSLRAGWGRTILWCSAIHVAAMGLGGWLAPSTWHGYLPPISLLSFLSALIALYLRRSRSGAASSYKEG